MPVRVFVCYAREEARFLQDFFTATADLRRHGVTFFHDGDVPWGEKWQETIFAHVDAADVFVMLLSAKCIASPHCMAEFDRAYANRQAGRCLILPVHAAPFESSDPRINDIQWEPSGKPITLRGVRAPSAWVEVARALRKRIASLPARHAGAVPPPPEPRSRGLWMAILVLVPVLIAGVVWLALALKPGAGSAGSADATVVFQVERQELQVSNSPLSCDKDKFDLDTNAPGHGDMPQLNVCNHGGRRADLILDPERLHTPSDDPLMLSLAGDQPADYRTCSAALDGSAGKTVGSLPISELGARSQLCLKTDEGLIAAVSVLDRASGRLTFSATVWRAK